MGLAQILQPIFRANREALKLVVHLPSDSGLLELLEKHPEVQVEHSHLSQEVLRFNQEGWVREVRIADAETEIHGLTELMDNNPMVCADVVSVPSPASTLALIGLGPVIKAGMVLEPPAIILSFESDEDGIGTFLKTEGWHDGVTVAYDPQDLGNVLAATCMAKIANPDSFSDIDELYEECFGRSFYVRRIEEGDWDIRLVAGKPWAAYRLRLSEGAEFSLLTIQVMADKNGKAGAAQMVHAMNVMAGFEESLGI